MNCSDINEVLLDIIVVINKGQQYSCIQKA